MSTAGVLEARRHVVSPVGMHQVGKGADPRPSLNPFLWARLWFPPLSLLWGRILRAHKRHDLAIHRAPCNHTPSPGTCRVQVSGPCILQQRQWYRCAAFTRP